MTPQRARAVGKGRKEVWERSAPRGPTGSWRVRRREPQTWATLLLLVRELAGSQAWMVSWEAVGGGRAAGVGDGGCCAVSVD